jgi:hypothetical protein
MNERADESLKNLQTLDTYLENSTEITSQISGNSQKLSIIIEAKNQRLLKLQDIRNKLDGLSLKNSITKSDPN